MNKMTLKIFRPDGVELLSVPFGTDHVTWAIRNSGFCGRIDERRIAQYIGELVWRAGNDWERQKNEWMKLRVGQLYQPGADLTEINNAVISEVADFLDWNPREGYNDDGSKIETTGESQ